MRTRSIRSGLLAASVALAGYVALPGCASNPAERASGWAYHETGAAGAEEAAVRTVLREQVAAWNAGSVRGFMEGYAQTDSLRFASGGNVRRGWQQALDAYERGYPNPAAMGTLRFDSLDVRVLSPEHALAFGRWQLQRAGDAPWGWFTLLLQKRPEGWRVVHDHTSAGP
ncbi:MAG: DUF4440 domain-containing protein [Rhodothermales bacterium]|nr:DUF4440 domain-containing protein [Rhodothermales bacterium]